MRSGARLQPKCDLDELFIYLYTMSSEERG